MIKKKISFVIDKKGEDILAPMFVPNHSYALRQYLAYSENEGDKPLFVRFPEDYLLVTGEVSFVNGDLKVGSESVTPFSDFIKVGE